MSHYRPSDEENAIALIHYLQTVLAEPHKISMAEYLETKLLMERWMKRLDKMQKKAVG